ncbi:metal-dependent hydrolase [Rheinheimera sp.]|uniref:metal-dependent hydrolase n=1 Tax=Rheinheimera sp. TaxID=1869214 RepID=UPI00307E3E5B
MQRQYSGGSEWRYKVDSLTQMALGGAVSITLLRKQIGVPKAALLGAVLGTAPDLDVLIEHGDPLSNMTQHRTETHALFYLLLLSPLLGWLLAKYWLQPRWFVRLTLAVAAVLLSHPLLDSLTIYGTQLALPFSNTPYGTGTVFVIDPLYTLLLLFGVCSAFVRPQGRANQWGLALSSVYLLIGLATQWMVSNKVMQQLQGEQQQVQKLLVTATPFNTALWRILVLQQDHYLEGYYSVFDGDKPVQWQVFRREQALLTTFADLDAVRQLSWFSSGFYVLEQHQQQLVLTDLRMGLAPYYNFSFVVAEQRDGLWQPVPVQQRTRPEVSTLHLLWLWQRIWSQTQQPLVQWLPQ